MIEKGSINWASVSSTPLEHKQSAERLDRRGVEKTTHWGDDVPGKVAAELRSQAPGENEANEKPTHRGDERRKKADTERRNGPKSSRRCRTEDSPRWEREWTWDKASEDREQHLDGLPQEVRPNANLKTTSIQRKKATAAKPASKIKNSLPDLRSFARDNFPATILSMAGQSPLKIGRPTALDPLGGGFIWPLDLIQAVEGRAGS